MLARARLADPLLASCDNSAARRSRVEIPAREARFRVLLNQPRGGDSLRSTIQDELMGQIRPGAREARNAPVPTSRNEAFVPSK